jgi:hypothetical protein
VFVDVLLVLDQLVLELLLEVDSRLSVRVQSITATADDFEAFALQHGVADVKPSQAEGRNFLAGAAQSAVDYLFGGFFLSPG